MTKKELSKSKLEAENIIKQEIISGLREESFYYGCKQVIIDTWNIKDRDVYDLALDNTIQVEFVRKVKQVVLSDFLLFVSDKVELNKTFKS
jgi:hypothetical protein